MYASVYFFINVGGVMVYAVAPSLSVTSRYSIETTEFSQTIYLA